jgi:uncharacterized protein (TIGR03435 family)
MATGEKYLLTNRQEALQAQMGLRLENGKIAAPFVLIDHVEKLSEN